MSEPTTNHGSDESIGRLLGEGVLVVVGGIVGGVLDVLGYWFFIGIQIAAIIGAYMVDPTLGAVVMVLIIGGWTLFAVVRFVGAIVSGIGALSKRSQSDSSTN
ncbi:hypothetical protein [Nocardioides pelophilus]|uniref:hypothetical protein n=1 Tax=Nocardioides pelophilus TaxID=2172019 RepID=UPI00160109CB|nr:hypothetical protein [Nocardioides pelophilus]